MAEEESKAIKPEVQSDNGGGNEDYASMLADTKKFYEAKMSEKDAANFEQVKKLTQMIINGQKSEAKAEPVAEKVKTRLELYKEFKANKPCTNMEFWKRQLDLREATIREYGKDPWVTGNYGEPAPGQSVNINPVEIDTMDKLAKQIQQLIDDAEGDPAKFNFLFNAATR